MTSPEAIACLVAALASYAIGATPFGYFAGRIRGVDIREYGSGNIGATNVLRVLGKGTGIPVFILDILKGLLPVLITVRVLDARGVPSDWPAICAAAGSVLGHNFTFWLRFRGGKGIATSAGVLMALLPIPLLAAVVCWIVLFYSTRYVALASIGAAISVAVVPLAMHLIRGKPALPQVGFGIFLGTLAVWRHRSNIRRLLNGTESRFVKKPPTARTVP